MALRDEMDVWLLWNEQTNTHFHPEVEMDFVVSGKLDVYKRQRSRTVWRKHGGFRKMKP